MVGDVAVVIGDGAVAVNTWRYCCCCYLVVAMLLLSMIIGDVVVIDNEWL